MNPETEKAHREACDNKQISYVDPTTNLRVLTEYFLKERRYCCSNGCRHCPYGEEFEKQKTKS